MCTGQDNCERMAHHTTFANRDIGTRYRNLTLQIFINTKPSKLSPVYRVIFASEIYQIGIS